RFERFAEKYPKSEHAPEAALRIGDCLFGEKQFAPAAAAYQKAAEGLKDEPAREAGYWLGMSRWKAGDLDGAVAAFRSLAGEGAKDSFAQRARLRLGELEAGRGDTEAATRAYRDCVAVDPASAQAEAASYALA